MVIREKGTLIPRRKDCVGHQIRIGDVVLVTKEDGKYYGQIFSYSTNSGKICVKCQGKRLYRECYSVQLIDKRKVNSIKIVR